MSSALVSAGSGQTDLQPSRLHAATASLLFISNPADADQHVLLAAACLLQQRDGAEDLSRCGAAWRDHLDVRWGSLVLTWMTGGSTSCSTCWEEPVCTTPFLFCSLLFIFSLICSSAPSFHLSTGAQLAPGAHSIPLSQLQGQPVTLQGPSPAPTATLQAPTTLLRLPAALSLTGQNKLRPLLHLYGVNFVPLLKLKNRFYKLR